MPRPSGSPLQNFANRSSLREISIGCVAGLSSARTPRVDGFGGDVPKRDEAGGKHVAFSEDTSNEKVGISSMMAVLTSPRAKASVAEPGQAPVGEGDSGMASLLMLAHLEQRKILQGDLDKAWRRAVL